MVEIKRRKGETFESFLRRFSKRLQQSGKLNEAKAKQFLQPTKSEAAKRKSALVGLRLRAKKEYLRKIGKLEEGIKKRW